MLSLHNTVESGTTFASVQFLLWWRLCWVKEKQATSLAGPCEKAYLVGPLELTYLGGTFRADLPGGTFRADLPLE